MRATRVKRSIAGLVAAAALAGAVWAAWPAPIGVDLGTVVRGPMEVTIDDEARTRVRNVYTVSAPIGGKVLRTSRRVGDEVVAEETVVAVMQPTAPSFLDVRSREELQAALAAAEAAVKLAEHEIHRIEAALGFSRTELTRAQALARTQTISTKAFDKAKFDVETNEAALMSAKALLEVRRSERATVAAKLIDPASIVPQRNPACCIQIRAPVTGRVLKLIQESETVVPPGAPLIDIGDPRDLEVVADLLSTDAVQIKVGAAVRIEGWGGAPVRGRVARVDPAGFVKVSALGIEEQRVRTTIDLVDPGEAWSRLGHEYRVVVRVAAWQADNVLTVPVGALFRRGEDWAVYALSDGRAQITPVKIGRRNNKIAEVLSGLSPGDRVALHPSDRIRDGTRIAERTVQ